MRRGLNIDQVRLSIPRIRSLRRLLKANNLRGDRYADTPLLFFCSSEGSFHCLLASRLNYHSKKLSLSKSKIYLLNKCLVSSKTKPKRLSTGNLEKLLNKPADFGNAYILAKSDQLARINIVLDCDRKELRKRPKRFVGKGSKTLTKEQIIQHLQATQDRKSSPVVEADPTPSPPPPKEEKPLSKAAQKRAEKEQEDQLNRQFLDQELTKFEVMGKSPTPKK